MKLTYTTPYESEHGLTLDEDTTLGFLIGLGASILVLVSIFI